jgi:hypothetical protein
MRVCGESIKSFGVREDPLLQKAAASALGAVQRGVQRE